MQKHFDDNAVTVATNQCPLGNVNLVGTALLSRPMSFEIWPRSQ